MLAKLETSVSSGREEVVNWEAFITTAITLPLSGYIYG